MKRTLQLFFRHMAFVTAVLLAILLIIERLIPGSILAYVNFLWLIPLLVIFIILSQTSKNYD